jgi:excisionase family DNA binding protein
MSGVRTTARRQGHGTREMGVAPMQGNRTLPSKTTAGNRTLADLLAAGELTCSAAQVAGWLNVSKPTVIAAARRGELPGRLVGKQWRFSTKALAKMWGLDQVSDQINRPDTTLVELPVALVNALRLGLKGGDAA